MQWSQPCSKASDAPPLGGVLSMEAPRRLRCCECRRRLRGGGDVSGQGGDVITSAETSRADGGDVSENNCLDVSTLQSKGGSFLNLITFFVSYIVKYGPLVMVHD